VAQLLVEAPGPRAERGATRDPELDQSGKVKPEALRVGRGEEGAQWRRVGVEL